MFVLRYVVVGVCGGLPWWFACFLLLSVLIKLCNLLVITLMFLIEVIRTDDSSVSAGPTPGSVPGPAPGFVADLAPKFVASPAPGFVAGPALGSINDSTPGSINDSAPSSVIISALGAVAGRVALVVVDSKTSFFYGKQVIAEEYTNSKLYTKGRIWIRGIPFGKIIKV